MKTVLLTLAAATILLAGGQRSRDSKPAKAATAEDRGPQSVPAGATQIEPNLYRYVDAKGKVWMYRKTPFGISKWEDKPESQPVAPQAVPVVVKDLGDSFQFERATPFGKSKWIRKKTELTDEEKEFVDQAQGRSQTPKTEKQ